jgi:hypothetical protein
MVKLCKECIHFLPGEYCAAAPKIDFIYGINVYWSCVTERTGILAEDCGMNARHWKGITASREAANE